MSHAIHCVVRFDIVAPYSLVVQFGDGTSQRIDFQPILHGPIFGPLQDLPTFNAVTLDAESGTLVWPNGADFDPATLHEWPSVCVELAARAREWAQASPDGQPSNKLVEPTSP